MHTDSIVEFFVERKKGPKAFLKYVGIGLIVFLMFLGLYLCAIINDGEFFSIAMFVAVGMIVLAVYLFNRQNIEHEYSFFSGELTIDRIINKSKRVNMVEFKLKDVDEMGLYKVGVTKLSDAGLNFTSNENADGGIYLRVPSSLINANKKVGIGANHTYIIVENDEKVKSALKPFIRASLYREAMKQIEEVK